jgi:hypothetical protein
MPVVQGLLAKVQRAKFPLFLSESVEEPLALSRPAIAASKWKVDVLKVFMLEKMPDV